MKTAQQLLETHTTLALRKALAEMTKTVCIIQARMGSTRFPGKVLADICGKPMLARVIDRVVRCPEIDQIIVAMPRTPDNQMLWRWCQQEQIPHFRGDEEDVLARYDDCAKSFGATIVVRITADCPLIDPALISACILSFRHVQPPADYVSNISPVRTYPDGLDVEVFSAAALSKARMWCVTPSEREHVTPFLQKDPRFRTYNLRHTRDLSALRWTVDTPEDLAFVRRLYVALTMPFSWQQILAFTQEQDV